MPSLTIETLSKTNAHGHRMLPEKEISHLAQSISQRKIYREALSKKIWPERYVRNAGSFSCGDQLQLMEKQVCVAGCGGLGGYIASFLARVGVGKLILFDPDTFDESNLNRQLFASGETLGQNKGEVTKIKLSDINPATLVESCDEKITSATGEAALAQCHLVADGLDSLSDRATLSRMARQAGIPMVHAAISGFEARIMTLWPSGPSFEELFGHGAQSTAEETLGTPAMTPAVAAGLQCTQIVNILLGRRQPGEPTMVHLDLLEMESASFSF